MEKVCWFNDWFDSPYYHLLYNNRNQKEAQFFINNLCNYIQLPEKSIIWDLACGKGRHSKELSDKNFHVIGTDISEKSLKEALTFKNENLELFLQDMRKPFKSNYFDCVVNLFTSIGYFEKEEDNFLVFENVYNSLKPNGIFVIDFFNASKISKNIASDYSEKRDGITFNISKKIINNAIHKLIKFEHQNKNYSFIETVSLLNLKNFENFAKPVNLKLVKTFGNYSLDPFNIEDSDRLIMIFKK